MTTSKRPQSASGSSNAKYELLEQELEESENLFGQQDNADPRQKLLRDEKAKKEQKEIDEGNEEEKKYRDEDAPLRQRAEKAKKEQKEIDEGNEEEKKYRDEDAPLRQRTLPLKTFVLSLFLFAFGSIVSAIGFLIQTGHIVHSGETHLGWMFIFLGLVTLLPGVWSLSVALMTYFGVEGYDDYAALPGED
eukprot:TRINITY_DN4306_c0_g1_i1.p1 TRINITY_DN4306_c0_g1~~TRINITY_DN4306_c0_g1_i1.p1  ORF type:complete len:206 (-),score=98.30 TRINITY_DN4306_c0_g1_i1:291-863(-)